VEPLPKLINQSKPICAVLLIHMKNPSALVQLVGTRLIVKNMEKKIAVTCEFEGTGLIAVADNGVEHVECGQHHPAFKKAPSVDGLF
jgi:hypothetical protein